jgi:hypothetical protein
MPVHGGFSWPLLLDDGECLGCIVKKNAMPCRWCSDHGEDPPDEPSGNRPAGAREEADAEPNADLVDVDFGRHVRYSL